MTKPELSRLLQTAHQANPLHHLALVVSLWHATRVSELLAIRSADIHDGQLIIRRLKGSITTNQPIRTDPDPLFDASPLINLAKQAPSADTRLFPWCRQRCDQFIRLYGHRANIDPRKCHMHSLRHSMAVMLWNHTGGNIGLLQRHLGHKSASSSLIYLYESDARKASAAVAEIRLTRVVTLPPSSLKEHAKTVAPTPQPPPTNDDALIESAIHDSAGFADLWFGHIESYPDADAADAALVQQLTLLTGGDMARVERLMHKSTLARVDWYLDDDAYLKRILGVVAV